MSVIHFVIARLCSVPLYRAQCAHFTRAAVVAEMRAFMLRHQEELDMYEIQMGFLPQMALKHFHLVTERKTPTPYFIILEKGIK